jgi:hypothetical protein
MYRDADVGAMKTVVIQYFCRWYPSFRGTCCLYVPPLSHTSSCHGAQLNRYRGNITFSLLLYSLLDYNSRISNVLSCSVSGSWKRNRPKGTNYILSWFIYLSSVTSLRVRFYVLKLLVFLGTLSVPFPLIPLFLTHDATVLVSSIQFSC